ncbi:hypothetical protein KCU67_g8446, partial [Aureobasidium melanogenum]
MGLPLNQAPGHISQQEPPTHNYLLSSASIATRVTTSESQVIQFNALPCQRVNRETRKTQADVMPVKPHRALNEYDVVETILSYLKDEPKTLAKLMRTCSLFFKAGARILWQDAQPNKDARRRFDFVPFLKNLTLWSHEQVYASETVIDPALWRVKTLGVYNSGSRAIKSTLLIPYLSSTLQKLTMHDGAQNFLEHNIYSLNKDCLVHIAATCNRLAELDLNVALDVTSNQLTQFFKRMPHLKVLRLGNDLEPLLDHEALSAVFTLPALKTLCLKPSISQDFAEELIRTHESQRILPSTTFIEIYFTEGDCAAYGNLLQTLTTLEGLTMTIHSTSEWPSALHPNFCEAISHLLRLQRLGIHLDQGVDLIDQDLAALYPLENLTSLGIWSQHGDTDYDVNNLHVSSVYFRDALFVLEFIGSVSIDLVWTGVLAPDEIQELRERGAASSHNWTLHSIITMEDEAGMGDYGDDEPDEVTPDDVWKGSLKAFSPDPSTWVKRDLNLFT